MGFSPVLIGEAVSLLKSSVKQRSGVLKKPGMIQPKAILALDERGILLLFRVNPDQFEQIDQVRISEQPTWGHLAICGNEIFIRELQAISAYRWNESTEVIDANNQERYWDGVLDELSLWHKTLKTQEVKRAMDGTILDDSGTSVDPVEKLTTTWGQLKLTN